MSVRILCIALGVFALSACGSSPPIPDDNYYRLTERPPFDRGPQVLAERLAVAPVRSAGVRRGRAMLYSEDPGHVRFKKYHYHHWDEAPSVLFQRRLVDSLQDSGIATSVTEKSDAQARYRLHTQVLRFDRLVSPDGADVIVEIEARLVPSDAPLNPVLDNRYTRQEVAGSQSMEATVVAFSRAVDAVIEDLVNDLRQADVDSL